MSIIELSLSGRGARGESQADILRRTGQFGVLPTDTDAEAVGKLNADAAASAALAEAVSGPVYANTAAGLAATASGDYFAVDAGSGLVSIYLDNAGTAVLQRTLATSAALAADTGSSLIGFKATGTGAVAQTTEEKLRTLQKDIADYGSFADFVGALPTATFAQNGADIQRAGHLLLGGAQINDKTFPNVERDWLTDYQVAFGFPNGTILSAQFAAINYGINSDTAGVGAVFGIQTLNFASASSWGLGCVSIVVANNTTYSAPVQAYYGEAHRTVGTGAAFGMELDTMSLTATITPTPFQQGDIVGVHIANGAEFGAAAYDASAGIQFAPNPKQFKVGINFMSDSLTSGLAISLAAQASGAHRIQWTNSAGHQAGALSSTNTGTNGHNMRFTNDGLQVSGSDGTNVALFAPIASGNNYLLFSGGTGTSAASVGAQSTVNSDVDLLLTPQGVGKVSFGTLTASGDAAVSGYITIKDASGTTRKLAVIT